MDATTALAPHDGIGILTLSHVVFGAATRRSGTASNDNVGTSWDFKLQKKNTGQLQQVTYPTTLVVDMTARLCDRDLSYKRKGAGDVRNAKIYWDGRKKGENQKHQETRPSSS